MLDAGGDRISSGPEQILVSLLLSQRLDERANELLGAVSNPPANNNAALGQAAREFVPQWRASAQTSIKVGDKDEKLRKKILASANTGRIFKDVIDHYGHHILLVLPIAEFFNYNRKQRTDNLNKAKTKALVQLVDHRRHEFLAKFLKVLVSLVKNWVTFTKVKPSLILNKVHDQKQFMEQVREIREQFKIPIDAVSSFSWNIALRPLDHWEFTASIAGWDLSRTLELTIPAIDASHSVNTQEILSDLMGRRIVYHSQSFEYFSTLDISAATMKVLCGLLPITTPDEHVDACVIEGDVSGTSQRIDAKSMNKRKTVCLVRLADVWVVVLLWKAEAGNGPFNKATVFTHAGHNGADTQSATQAVQFLGLDNLADVKVLHVNVPMPSTSTSGIHAICHTTAIRSGRGYWLTDLSDDHIRDIRHALLRFTSMAFIRAAAAEAEK